MALPANEAVANLLLIESCSCAAN